MKYKITQFATSFLILQKIHKQKHNLRNMFILEKQVRSKWAKKVNGKKATNIILVPSFQKHVKNGAKMISVAFFPPLASLAHLLVAHFYDINMFLRLCLYSLRSKKICKWSNFMLHQFSFICKFLHHIQCIIVIVNKTNNKNGYSKVLFT